jgi:hypothetical protein
MQTLHQFIAQIAANADLNDESSMFDALEIIGRSIAANGTDDQKLYFSCVDMEDPSQMYDALEMYAR